MICFGKWSARDSLGFCNTNKRQNHGHVFLNDKKKRTCQRVDLTVPTDDWGKFKEMEKNGEIQDSGKKNFRKI